MKLYIICLILCLTNIKVVLSDCSTLQNERLEHCYYKYFNSFGIFEDSREYLKKESKLIKTWPGFVQVCKKFNGLQECLGDEIMEDCMKYDEFLELFDNGLDMSSNYHYLSYTCGKGFSIKKETFICMQKTKISCEIENLDCHSLKPALLKCANFAKKSCGEKGFIYQYNQALATLKPLFSHCSIPYIDGQNGLNKDKNTFSTDNKHVETNEDDEKNSEDEMIFLLIEKTLKMLTLNFSSDELSKSGVLPIIVESLKSTNFNLQLKAIKVLDVMSKKGLQYCHLIVEAEAITPLINLLESSNFEIFDSALDVLGEIVQRSYRFRNYCIEQGIIEPLIKLVKNETAIEKLKSIGYAMNFILIHTGSQIYDDIITTLFPVLNHFLYHDNPSIQMTAVGSYYLLDKNFYGQIFIENGVVKRIIDFLESSDSGLLRTSLLFLQDFAAEMSHPNIQYLIDNGALKNVNRLLKHFNEKVKIEIIDFISSFITSSNLTQKQILFNDQELLTSLINFLDHKNPAVRISTIEMLLKIVYRVNSKQIISMVNENMVYKLCTLLKDNEMMHEILLILKTMMKKSDEKAAMKIIEALQNCDANKIFTELFNHNNEKIVEATTVLTNEIVDAYLWDERRKKDSHEEL